MEFNSEKICVFENEIVHEGTVEQTVDSDIQLPDYCPDIVKILKCSIEPNITDTNITGDRITIDGRATIRLIYSDEDNNIRCFEQDYPFSKYFEDVSVSDDVTAVIKRRTEFANCRAVSPRKADVHGNIAISFKLYKKSKREIVSKAEGMGVQLRKRSDEVSDFNSVVCKSFSVEEVVEIGEKNTSPESVIKQSAVAQMTEKKVINDKILIKGELNLSVLYCDEENEISLFKSQIPFTQIIEINGISETSDTDVFLNVDDLDVKIKTDSLENLFQVNAKITATVFSSDKNEAEFALDTYSLSNELDCKKVPVKFSKRIGNINETAVVNGKSELSTGIKKIVDARCTNIKSKAVGNGENIVINGTMIFSFLYYDRENKPAFAEREIDFEYKKNMADCKDINVNYDIFVMNVGANIIGDNTVEVKAEYCVCAGVYKTEIMNVLSEITVLDKKTSNNKCPLTVYFATQNEKLWDIARKYNSTVEKIKDENSLNEDILQNDTMLMITAF